MIDNFDSFTFNLVHYLEALGAAVTVVMNDQIDLHGIEQLAPSHIIISPGPGHPREAGISSSLVAHFKGKIPILGVCLGHQVIGQYFGGQVSVAPEIMHGKTSHIEHNNQGLFADIKRPFIATRYHSLVLKADSLPSELTITAWTKHKNGDMDQVMAIQHLKHALFGVQFHPESVLTQCGQSLLKNFLNWKG
ncbi:MAG: aminodeoxychorismate/anthranilate synthase component II [Enterobacterales bacterium]|nr:aminodeoxychorismate/anthranilate synthase component II [Enterobacterales bacterium]